MPVVHFPFPDQEIEVVRRGIRRSGDLELALRVEFHFRNRDTFVRRQLFIFAGAKWESARTRLMVRQFLGTKVYRIVQPKGKPGGSKSPLLHVRRAVV